MRLTVTDYSFPYNPSKEITANLWTRLMGMFRTTEERIFSSLLEGKFLSDLKLATYLTSLSEEEITPEQQIDLSSLMDAYYPEGKCPSHLFPFVSRRLQRKYNNIHTQICDILYKDS